MWGGWFVAAGLLGLLAIRGSNEAAHEANTDSGASGAGAADPVVAVAALREAPGVLRAPWVTDGIRGEVVWSDDSNVGFMVIDGLTINDPTVSQYQLWIFRGDDPAAEPHPIDGGLFDVAEGGAVVVPIDAKLRVGMAGLFAVTVEPPGGVVVSKREPIVAVAVRS